MNLITIILKKGLFFSSSRLNISTELKETFRHTGTCDNQVVIYILKFKIGTFLLQASTTTDLINYSCCELNIAC